MNKITKEYIIKFKELPLLISPLTYDDYLYQELMEKAIKNNIKITKEQILQTFNKESYDLI